MKIFTVFIIFLILVLQAIKAQDYLISFAAIGDTNSASTIKVDNLTSGATVSLNWGDILHLTEGVGIDNPGTFGRDLQIYPNPIKNQAFLTFFAPEAGNVVLCVVEPSGKIVYQSNMILPTGSHSFRLSGINPGIYFIKIIGKTFSYSTKLISQSNKGSNPVIEYASSLNNSHGITTKITAVTVDMRYTDGDILMYTGTGGRYTTVITDVPTTSKTTTFNFVLCQDSDGHTYSTVEIGVGKAVQIWMAQNLNTGVRIDGDFEQTNNSIIEKYCYNNLETNCDVYGGLYQWAEMVLYFNGASNTNSWNPEPTGNIIGICPAGWHLPTETEWCTLTQFLDPSVNCSGNGMIGTDIGGKMKETGTNHWSSPNTGATNSSGFTVIPGGYRRSSNGQFNNLNLGADFWPASEFSASQAWDRYFYYNNVKISRTQNAKADGYSVRCLKD